LEDLSVVSEEWANALYVQTMTKMAVYIRLYVLWQWVPTCNARPELQRTKEIDFGPLLEDNDYDTGIAFNRLLWEQIDDMYQDTVLTYGPRYKQYHCDGEPTFPFPTTVKIDP
ncbi:hypothetical protein KIPB_013760, partial [Kipferlia bialata]